MLNNYVEEVAVEVLSKRLRPKLTEEFYNKLQSDYFYKDNDISQFTFLTEALSVHDKFISKTNTPSTLDYTITQTLLEDDSLEMAEQYIEDRDAFNKVRDEVYRKFRDENREVMEKLYKDAMNASFPSPWDVKHEESVAFTDINLADSVEIVIAFTGTKLLMEDMKKTYQYGEGQVYNTHYTDMKEEDLVVMKESLTKSLYTQWFDFRRARIEKNIEEENRKKVNRELKTNIQRYEEAAESSRKSRIR